MSSAKQIRNFSLGSITNSNCYLRWKQNRITKVCNELCYTFCFSPSWLRTSAVRRKLDMCFILLTTPFASNAQFYFLLTGNDRCTTRWVHKWKWKKILSFICCKRLDKRDIVILLSSMKATKIIVSGIMTSCLEKLTSPCWDLKLVVRVNSPVCVFWLLYVY